MEAGGLPNPTAATLWGPESVPHIPSAGTMWSLRPTGRVFSDQAHTGSPRAVMEGPQPPASDRPEDGSHSCLPLGTPDPGPPLGAVRAQTPGVGDPISLPLGAERSSQRPPGWSVFPRPEVLNLCGCFQWLWLLQKEPGGPGPRLSSRDFWARSSRGEGAGGLCSPKTTLPWEFPVAISHGRALSSGWKHRHPPLHALPEPETRAWKGAPGSLPHPGALTQRNTKSSSSSPMGCVSLKLSLEPVLPPAPHFLANWTF